MLAFILSSVELNEHQKSRLEEIYYKYRELLFSYAKRIVSNDADAEDVLQNTFMKIANSLNKVGDTDSKETAAFFIVITRNTAYDFLRRRSRYHEIPLEHISETISDGQSVEALASKLEYKKIVSAIKRIPSPYQEVLYLHYVCDYSIKNTARLLDRKAQTVKTQLVRGKKLLLKHFSEAIYDEC